MLESKFALNNLNFKCYIQFFLLEHELDQKTLPGNPRIGQHPGKGGVKSPTLSHPSLPLKPYLW